MKFLISIGVAAATLTSAAFAGELADACIARLEAEGRDTSGCSCLEAKVAGNTALMTEFQELGELDDVESRYEAASDEAKAAMDACTR